MSEITIDLANVPAELVVTKEDGTQELDYSKIKTQTDVEKLMNAKDNLRNEFNQYKEKYKGVDLNKYNEMVSKEFEANKDILDNPVYKNLAASYNDLKTKNDELNRAVMERDQKLFDDSLRDQIRGFKGVETTAVDDILYRAKSAGFSKTENGILAKDGRTVEKFMTELQESAPHLFKRSVGAGQNYQTEKLKNAIKNGSLADILLNSPLKN